MKETVNFNKAMEELKNLMHKMDVAEDNKKYDLAYTYDVASECKADHICDIFYKIRDIEESIKKIDFNFKSSIKEPQFL